MVYYTWEMHMNRDILKDLLDWKEDKNRKPLIIRGARQGGKTYAIKEFGEKYYHNIAYFNFDKNERLQSIFEDSKNPFEILEKLSFVYGKKITPNDTLVVFDEIQECPNALNSLKYFEEDAKE